MTEVFAVFREGIYRHECGGVFSTLGAAKACALELARTDGDDYHTYEVVPFVLDQLPELGAGTGSRSPAIEEAERAFSCRHQKQGSAGDE